MLEESKFIPEKTIEQKQNEAVEYLEGRVIAQVCKSDKGFKLELLSGKLLSNVSDYFSEGKKSPIKKLIVPDQNQTSKAEEGILVEITQPTRDTKPEDPRRGVYFVGINPIPQEIIKNLPSEHTINLFFLFLSSEKKELQQKKVIAKQNIPFLTGHSFSGIFGGEREISEVLKKLKLESEPQIKSERLKQVLTKFYPLTEDEISEILTTKVVEKIHILPKTKIKTITQVDKLDEEVLLKKRIYEWDKDEKDAIKELIDKHKNKFIIAHLVGREWICVIKDEDKTSKIEQEYIEEKRKRIKEEYELHKEALVLSKQVKKNKSEDLSEKDPYESGFRDIYVIDDPRFKGKEYIYEYFDGDFTTPSKWKIDERAVLIHVEGDKKVFDYDLLRW